MSIIKDLTPNPREILHLSDRVLVSRQGRIVEEFKAAEATETMIMYAGSPLKMGAPVIPI